MQSQNSPHGSDANRPGDGWAPGRIVDGRFLIERDLTDHTLGGGFRVFMVKDLKEYCRDAMLKVLAPPPADLDSEGPTVADVAVVLGRTAQPNIEEILETGRFPDGRWFALTPVYRATPLDRLIAPDRRLELSGVAQLVEQLTEALGAAHAGGVLHCDLRPANILIPDGDIGANPARIVNFGCAWPIDARGESLCRVAPGAESLHYAAPELLVALGHRSAASDVYSLAVLVYRLVTGALPFSGRERADMLNAINAGSPVPPADSRTDLSDEAAMLILSGLRFEPALRSQNIEDFGLRLLRSLEPPRGIQLDVAEPSAVVSEPVVEVSEPAPAPEPEPSIRTAAVIEPAPLFREDESELVLAKPVASRPAVSDRVVAWALIILLMAGALSIPIGQTFLKDTTQAAPIEPIAARAPARGSVYRLRYRLEDQAAGSAAYERERGARQLAFAADPAGEAVVLSEFSGDDGRPAYRLLFRSSPSAGQSEKPTLAVPLPSTGPVWIVWAPGRDSDLEGMLASASKDGLIADDDRRPLRHYLERNRGLRITEDRDPATGQTVLTGSGERIVYRIEPEGEGPPRNP